MSLQMQGPGCPPVLFCQLDAGGDESKSLHPDSVQIDVSMAAPSPTLSCLDRSGRWLDASLTEGQAADELHSYYK